MRPGMSFQEILEEKMGAATPDSSREIPNSDPRHMAFLLGQIPVFRFARPVKVRPAQARPAQARPAPKKARPEGPAHALTPAQAEAFLWFKSRGESLPGDFLPTELKSAYRRLALKMHPDAETGSAQAFLELQARKTVLEKVAA